MVKVSFPLNCIIGEKALEQYNRIAVLLMKIKRAKLALEGFFCFAVLGRDFKHASRDDSQKATAVMVAQIVSTPAPLVAFCKYVGTLHAQLRGYLVSIFSS